MSLIARSSLKVLGLKGRLVYLVPQRVKWSLLFSLCLHGWFLQLAHTPARLAEMHFNLAELDAKCDT